MASAASDPRSFPLTELISPELALVDPELAARARHLAPVQWGPDRHPRARLETTPGPSGRAPRHEAASSGSQLAAGPPVRQRVWPLHVVAAAAATAGTLLAGLAAAFWLLGQPPVSRGSGAEGSRPPLAAPLGGGYASGGVLSFEVAASSWTVALTRLNMPCAGGTSLPEMKLRPDLTFTFHGRLRGSRGPATVDVVGSFRSRSAALVMVRERGPGCGDSTRRLIARLS